VIFDVVVEALVRLRGRNLALSKGENRLIYRLQESFPRSAKGRSFNLCPPAGKDLNKSGRFGFCGLMSRGGCIYPTLFRQTLLGGLRLPTSPAKEAKEGQYNDDDDDDQKPGWHVSPFVGWGRLDALNSSAELFLEGSLSHSGRDGSTSGSSGIVGGSGAVSGSWSGLVPGSPGIGSSGVGRSGVVPGSCVAISHLLWLGETHLPDPQPAKRGPRA
jgi:hypothetical protein